MEPPCHMNYIFVSKQPTLSSLALIEILSAITCTVILFMFHGRVSRMFTWWWRIPDSVILLLLLYKEHPPLPNRRHPLSGHPSMLLVLRLQDIVDNESIIPWVTLWNTLKLALCCALQITLWSIPRVTHWSIRRVLLLPSPGVTLWIAITLTLVRPVILSWRPKDVEVLTMYLLDQVQYPMRKIIHLRLI